MRGLKLGARSVYRGLKCLHCHRKVRDGSAVLASTFYVCAAFPSQVHTQSQNLWLKRATLGLPKDGYDEIEVRVLYHRRCIEKILLRAPVDPEVEEADFEAYRLELLERLGLDETMRTVP